MQRHSLFLQQHHVSYPFLHTPKSESGGYRGRYASPSSGIGSLSLQHMQQIQLLSPSQLQSLMQHHRLFLQQHRVSSPLHCTPKSESGGRSASPSGIESTSSQQMQQTLLLSPAQSQSLLHHYRLLLHQHQVITDYTLPQIRVWK